MHSPETIAFEIYLGRKKKKNGSYRNPFITIWHNDPEKDGTDDSCGWFVRSRHCDQEKLKEIKKQFDFNFDSIFVSNNSGRIYNTGYFKPDGTPNMSPAGITLDLFYRAAFVHFNRNRIKTRKWINKNLFEILNFAENPVDSLYSEITGQFRSDEKWNREYAINHYADIIYAWICRDVRPWYKHPRWHIWHWSIQINPIQKLKRRFWDKCSVCGKRGFKESAISDWDGKTIWHQKCDNSIKCPTPTDI